MLQVCVSGLTLQPPPTPFFSPNLQQTPTPTPPHPWGGPLHPPPPPPPSPPASDSTSAGEHNPDGCHRWAFPLELPAPAQCVLVGVRSQPSPPPITTTTPHEMHVVTGNKRRAPVPDNSRCSPIPVLLFQTPKNKWGLGGLTRREGGPRG